MKSFKPLILLPCLFLLTGCWSATEINKLSIVLGVGIEKTKEDEVQVVTQVAVPDNLGSNKEQGGDGAKYMNFVTYDRNPVDGIFFASQKSGNKLSLSHNLLVLLGENAAKDGIYKYIDYFLRDTEPRLNIIIAVAEGDIKDILGTDSDVLSVPAEYIWSLADMQKKSVGGGLVRLIDFTQNLMQQSDGTLLPIVKIDEASDPPALTIDRAAVFKGDKMVDTVSLDTVRGIMWMQDRVEGGVLTAGEGDDTVTYKVNKSKTRRKISIDNGVSADFKISLDLSAVEDNGNKLKDEGAGESEKRAAENVISQVQAALDEAKRIGVDILHIADEIYKRDPQYWNSIKDNWEKIFPSIEVNVSADCVIRYSGLVSGTPSRERKDE